VDLAKTETTTINTPTSYPNLNVLLLKKANAQMPVFPVETLKCSNMLSEVTIAPPRTKILDFPGPMSASIGRSHRSMHSKASIQTSVARQLFQKRRLRALPPTPTGKCLPMPWTCMKPRKGRLPIRLFTQIQFINRTMSSPRRTEVLACLAKGEISRDTWMFHH
jgi:hypothetical protein